MALSQACIGVLFQRESLRGVQSEIIPLTKLHFDEVYVYSEIELAPQLEVFQALEDQGQLLVFTARKADRTLSGYALFNVGAHLYFRRSIQARQLLLYMLPECRGFAMSFIRFCDEEMAKLNVDVVIHSVTPKKDFSRLLIWQGYELHETVYSRRLK